MKNHGLNNDCNVSDCIAKIIAEKSIIETNNIIVNQWDEIIETFNI